MKSLLTADLLKIMAYLVKYQSAVSRAQMGQNKSVEAPTNSTIGLLATSWFDAKF